MNVQVSGINVVVYRNPTSITHFVTMAVSGRAEAEVRTASASGNIHLFDDHGGMITLEVPSSHHIEIDAKTPQRKVESTIISVK